MINRTHLMIAMTQRQAIFHQMLLHEVFIVPEWRCYSSVVFNAGVRSVDALVATSELTLNSLNIPRAPLDRLRQLQHNLENISRRTYNTTSFAQPLIENPMIRDFSFIPCFAPVDYIRRIEAIPHQEDQINRAVEHVNAVGTRGLTRHQAIMIVLYSQENSNQRVSFYYLLNRVLRERGDDLVSFLPSLYLLDAGLRSLPSVARTTWRGQNWAPDMTKFVVDRVVCFAGLCSTSEDKYATLPFMDKAPPHGVTHSRTLFKLIMTEGYSIQHFSKMKNEQEVVAGFCSRWRVCKVEYNHLEDFGPIGNYPCDVFIELCQLPYEPLFDTIVTPFCGLHVLSLIDTSRLRPIPNGFKRQFVDLFASLTDADSRALIIEHLGDLWNVEEARFRGDVDETDAMDNVCNLLIPLRELRVSLTYNDTDLRRCFDICREHKIYCQWDLFFTETGQERTIQDFRALGFSGDDATKLYDRHGEKQDLLSLYSRVEGLKGDSENPRNVTKWLKYERLKRYVFRDGMMVGMYAAVQSFYNGVLFYYRHAPGCTRLCQIEANCGRAILRRGDIAIAVAFGIVHLGAYCLQWWYGDITFRQLIKSSIVALATLSTGILAALLTVALGPVGLAGTLLAVITGGLSAGSIEFIVRSFLEHFFPDGDLEEINAKRLLYHRALGVLDCSTDSTLRQVQTRYRELALAFHPDKTADKDDSQFKTILAAYEIVKTYHESLDAACQRLNIPRETLSKETLAHWNTHARPTTNSCKEVDRAYEILDRDVNYISSHCSWLRNTLSLHNAASVSDAHRKKLSLPLPKTS